MPPHDNGHPDEPHRPGDDAVRDLPLDRVPAQHEAEAAVDDAQREDEPAPPDVRDGPDGAALVLFVHVVVDEAADGLENEGADDDDADDGVAVARRELERCGFKSAFFSISGNGGIWLLVGVKGRTCDSG